MFTGWPAYARFRYFPFFIFLLLSLVHQRYYNKAQWLSQHKRSSFSLKRATNVWFFASVTFKWEASVQKPTKHILHFFGKMRKTYKFFQRLLNESHQFLPFNFKNFLDFPQYFYTIMCSFRISIDCHKKIKNTKIGFVGFWTDAPQV